MNVIGHAHLLKRLRKLLTAESLPHALLFVGPQSLGKRRIADWLAQRIAPKHPERIIILAAEDLNIDAVRSLRRIAALSAPKKAPHVVILDGIADLSIPAANALLKTLEEPSGAIHFILIAHGDGSDVLPTIRSRSALFRFTPVPRTIIVKGLCKNNAMTEKEAEQLARRSFGAPGRAMLLHKGADIKEKELCHQFIEHIGNPLVDRFALVKNVVDDEESALFLMQGLLFLRDVMLFQEGCDDLMMNEDIESTEHTARSLASERLRAVLHTMLSLESVMKTSNVNKRLALEEAVLML